MTDQRLNPHLIHDILAVLDQHGYPRADDEHARRAILLIGDLAHIYEGAQDHPFGPYINEASPSQTEPPTQDAVTVPTGELKTLLAALDVAADYKRDRAAACAQQHQPILFHLRVTSAARPDLRPPRRPPHPGGRGLSNRPWARQSATAHRGPRGGPVTRHPPTL